MIDPRTLKPYADGVSDGITVSEEEHATTYHGEDGSYPIPVIQDHELRIRKLEELLTTPTIRNADAADALRYFQHPGQTVSPLKESAGLWHPYKDWKAKDSAPVEPAPGSDAEHPPLGYRLAKVAEKREPGYVFWDGEGWIEGGSTLFGSPVDRWHSSPCANPITANEGDSRAAESVAIPVGWIKSMRQMLTSPQVWRPLMAAGKCVGAIEPDPSIPWGEGYEASLPEEAEKGYEYLAGSEWVAPLDPSAWSAEARMAEVWRRKVQPEAESLADRVSDSIADDVQRMQVAIETLTDERDRLRARVAEVEAENAERDAAHKADADLAASLHLENAGLRAEVERNVTSVLVDHARGVLPHRYEGACPDSVEGPDARDPECPVCRAIDSVSRLRPISLFTNEEAMRKVIIKKRGVAEGTQGVLLTWGIDATEEGGSNTIAIIELEDGSLVEAYPTCIQFCEPIMRQLAATPSGIARACGLENEVEAAQEAGLPDKIAESVVQDLQQACYDRDELSATVERLTAELDATKRLLAESLVERDRLKNLHDARKVRIDGFRDVLREHLGDLV